MELIEQVKIIVKSLKSDDNIQLIIYHLQEGLTKENWNKDDRIFTKATNQFYSQINGLQLIWIRKDNPFYDEKIHKERNQPFPWLEMWKDDYPYDGAIMILPLEFSFTHNWENITWYEMERQYKTTYLGTQMSMLDFKKQIIPFDVFSKYYSVSYFLGDPDDSFTLLLGQDNGADYTSCKRFSFEQYIDLLITTKGDVKKRVEAMESSWGNLD